MNEEFKPQVNSEKNLAFERAEAVALHNQRLAEYNAIPEADRQWNVEKNTTNDSTASEKNSEMLALRKNVGNIDAYRELAKPQEEHEYMLGDISGTEKLQAEKKRVDSEVEKTKKAIDMGKFELNQLRSKLGMPETEDIPSLIDKKAKLNSLLAIQKDLEGRITFEQQKIQAQTEEKTEDSKREKRNFNENLQEIVANINKVARMFEERNSRRYNSLFANENQFRSVASNLGDLETVEEIKSKLNRIGAFFESGAPNTGGGINDNPESLYMISQALRQLAQSIAELPSRIKDEEQRKEFSTTPNAVADKVTKASGYAARKAQALGR